MGLARLDPEASAMCCDDRPADGEPHPMPFGFLVKKGSKMRSADLRIEPRACVLDRDEQAAIFGGGGGDRQHPGAVCDPAPIL